MSAQSRANSFDDPSVPHPARRYNYLLGGRENYRADRASGDAIAAAMPTIRLSIQENRAFLRRVVRFMADEGIRQFIDIGPGIPAPDCTHEVAQAIAPETRVVYVDNDPVVIAYSRALLRNNAIPEDTESDDGSVVTLELPPFDQEHPAFAPNEDPASQPVSLPTPTPTSLPASLPDSQPTAVPTSQHTSPPTDEDPPRKGLIGHVLADLCDADRILRNAETRAVIDFAQPVGLLLVAVAHFCMDDETVYPAVASLIAALPPGSLVAFTHAVADYVDPKTVTRVDHAHADHKSDFRWRRTFECKRFADGLELIDPGLVPVEEWRAEHEPQPRPTRADVGICAWVARKP